MVERPQRLAALSVLGGSLHGRRHDLEEVVTEVLIGSDPDCHLHVDLPSISPIHARLWTDLNGAIAHDTRAPQGLYVNITRVESEAPIKEGDVLWLGPPQDPGSVCIQCHFEPWVEVLPAAPIATDAVSGESPGTDAAEGASGAILPDAQEPVALEGSFVSPPEVGEVESPAALLSDEAPSAPTAAPLTPGPPVGDEASTVAFLPDEGSPLPPADAGSGAGAPSPEEDPFFVGDVGGPGAREGPLPAVSEEPAPVPTDDWSFDETPAGSAPSLPSPPSPTPPSGEFVIAEDAVFVEAEPTEAPPVPAAPRPPPPAPPTPGPASEAKPGTPRPAHPGPEDSGRAPLPPRQVGSAEATAGPAPGVAVGPAAEPVARAEAGTPSPVTRAARPAPSTPRPRPAGARRAPVAGPRRGARRARSGPPSWLRPVALSLVGVGVAGAAAVGIVQWLGRTVRLDEVSPSRVRVGQRATLVGSGFSTDPGGNTVLFGDRPAQVLQASATRLEVEVPEAVAEAGAERRVPVVVKRGAREAPAVEVSVFQGPRLHGLSPDVAMPGEEVLLAGAGWGLGATVRFGEVAGTVLEADATQIRAIVPPLQGGPGTAAPVVVTVGGIESNPAPFFLGRLPLVLAVEPPMASAGDVVAVSGRGFLRDRERNDVRVGGRGALVISAFADELRIVVPRVSRSEAAPSLEVRVPGSTEVGQTTLPVQPTPDPLPLHFVAEPFPGPPERPHAVLTTGLGPAFVLAAAGGRSAAERAIEAQQRLNRAAADLARAPGLVPEARDLASSPVIGLAGRPDVLLEVTPEDAAAYEEDWTRLRGRGGPVTPARLARWWEAVARDLVLLLVRNERPRFAAALAPEGRVLQEVFDAAQGSGRPGVPRDLVAGARASLADGLRLAALRVPASVTAAVPAAPGTAVPAATPTPQRAGPLRLEGTWSGSENEGGQRRYLTVQFRRGSGSIAYEGGITLTVPFLGLQQPRQDQVRFTVEFRGGLRHYHGRWDGETLAGDIARDEAGRSVIGTFELRPR